MRGCEVRCLTDNTVLLRLSRSDQIANYDKLGGSAHAGLQWSTDFNPSTAHLEIHDRRLAESRRWREPDVGDCRQFAEWGLWNARLGESDTLQLDPYRHGKSSRVGFGQREAL